MESFRCEDLSEGRNLFDQIYFIIISKIIICDDKDRQWFNDGIWKVLNKTLNTGEVYKKLKIRKQLKLIAIYQ